MNIYDIFPFLFLPSLPLTTELLKALNSLAANPALSVGKFFSSCCFPVTAKTALFCDCKLSLQWSKRWSILKQTEGLNTCKLAPRSCKKGLDHPNTEVWVKRLPPISSISTGELEVCFALQISHYMQVFEVFLPSSPEGDSETVFCSSKN